MRSLLTYKKGWVQRLALCGPPVKIRASLGPSLGGSVQWLRAVLKKSVSEAFCAALNGSQFHAGATIDGNTLLILKDAKSDYGDGSTRFEGVVDPQAHPEIIALYLVFPFQPSSVNRFPVNFLSSL